MKQSHGFIIGIIFILDVISTLLYLATTTVQRELDMAFFYCNPVILVMIMATGQTYLAYQIELHLSPLHAVWVLLQEIRKRVSIPFLKIPILKRIPLKYK